MPRHNYSVHWWERNSCKCICK